MKCKWDDEIAAAVAAKQLEAWMAKCLALLLLIGFDGRKVHCLTLRLLAVYFDVFFAIFQSEMQFSPFNFECPRFRAVPRQSNLIEMGSLISFFGASKVHNTIMCIGK